MRCLGHTKSGNQCRRTVKVGTHCHQHKCNGDNHPRENHRTCEGTTKSGSRCRRRVKAGVHFCHHHTPSTDNNVIESAELDNVTPTFYEPDCAVCFDPIKESEVLSCGHSIHKECVILSGKLQCPICRETNLTNFTASDRVKCNTRAREMDRRERERIRNEELTVDELIGLFLVANPHFVPVFMNMPRDIVHEIFYRHLAESTT